MASTTIIYTATNINNELKWVRDSQSSQDNSNVNQSPGTYQSKSTEPIEFDYEQVRKSLNTVISSKKYPRSGNTPLKLLPGKISGGTKSTLTNNFNNEKDANLSVNYHNYSTLLYTLCKSVIRTPIIMLVISTSNIKHKYNEQLVQIADDDKANAANYKKLFEYVYINQNDYNQNNSFDDALSSLLGTKKYEEYTKLILMKDGQKKIRIDHLAFFLSLLFKNIFGKNLDNTQITQFNPIINTLSVLSTFAISSVDTLFIQGKIDNYNAIETYLNGILKDHNPILTFIKYRYDSRNLQNGRLIHPKYANLSPTLQSDTNKTELTFDYDTKDRQPKRKFKFGPFSNIFTTETNIEIAKSHQFKDVIGKMESGIPVCVIGYGASGSGKTSTLIQLTVYKPDGKTIERTEKGVLIELSNIISKVKKTAVVTVLEYYVDDIGKNIIPSLNANNHNVVEYKKHFDIVKPPNENQPVYRLNNYEKVYNFDSNQRWSDTSDNYMEDDIDRLLKTDRVVFPTTNNIESSRSHVIISIQFKTNEVDTTKPYKLIICDFAGIENIFSCENKDVLNKFISTNNGRMVAKDIAKNIIYEKVEETYKLNSDGLIKRSNLDHPSEERISGLFRKGLKLASVSFDKPLENGFKINKPSIPGIGSYSITKEDVFAFFERHIQHYKKYNNLIYNKDNQKYPIGVALDKDYELFNPDAGLGWTIRVLKRMVDKLYLYSTNDMSKKPVQKDEIIKSLHNDPKFEFVTNVNNSPSSIRYVCGNLLVPFVKANYKDLSPNVVINYFAIYPHNVIIRKPKDNDYPEIQYGEENVGSKKLYENVKSAALLDEEVNALINLIYKNGNKIQDDVTKLFTFLTRCAFEFESSRIMGEDDNTTNIKSMDDSNAQIVKKMCYERVKEGYFINKSLKDLRKFIADIVKNKTTGYPSHISDCLPIQCNPYFKECFGKDEYTIPIMDDQSSVVFGDGNGPFTNDNFVKKELKRILGTDFDNLLVCVVCVLNFSNTTEPAPYICISSLQYEYNRLMNMENELFNTNEDGRDPFLPGEIEYRHLKASIENLKIQITNIRELDEGSRNTIERFCNIILDEIQTKPEQTQVTEYTVSNNLHITLMSSLEKLIEFVNNSNSVTLIGTLEFMDMVSKYGENQVTCQVTDTISTYNA